MFSHKFQRFSIFSLWSKKIVSFELWTNTIWILNVINYLNISYIRKHKKINLSFDIISISLLNIKCTFWETIYGDCDLWLGMRERELLSDYRIIYHSSNSIHIAYIYSNPTSNKRRKNHKYWIKSFVIIKNTRKIEKYDKNPAKKYENVEKKYVA